MADPMHATWVAVTRRTGRRAHCGVEQVTLTSPSAPACSGAYYPSDYCKQVPILDSTHMTHEFPGL